MKRNSLIHLLLESAFYGLFGSLFVLAVILIEDTQKFCSPNFSCGSVERGIPLGPVFIATVVSTIFWNRFFGNIIKSVFTRWTLIVVTSSITAIFLQTAYIVSVTPMTIEQIISFHPMSEILGVKLMHKLFIILAPFTILFAYKQLIFEKFKNRNSLK